MNMKWLYERDFIDTYKLIVVAQYWMECGYRVFIQGYSSMDAYEFGIHN